MTVEALTQHFHARFQVGQGARLLVQVVMLDVVVDVAYQLQQLAAVLPAQLFGRQLQVKQADVAQFRQVNGEQCAVGADALVIAAQFFEVTFAVVAELFEQESDALAIGAAAVLRGVFAQGSEVSMGAGEGLFVECLVSSRCFAGCGGGNAASTRAMRQAPGWS